MGHHVVFDSRQDGLASKSRIRPILTRSLSIVHTHVHHDYHQEVQLQKHTQRHQYDVLCTRNRC